VGIILVIGDPRHIGELRAVIRGAVAVIVWNDTGWCSDDIRVRHVRAVANDAKAERAVPPPRQPKHHKRASDATLELYRRRKANREQENA
jgi:hypothetical protein